MAVEGVAHKGPFASLHPSRHFNTLQRFAWNSHPSKTQHCPTIDARRCKVMCRSEILGCLLFFQTDLYRSVSTSTWDNLIRSVSSPIHQASLVEVRHLPSPPFPRERDGEWCGAGGRRGRTCWGMPLYVHPGVDHTSLSRWLSLGLIGALRLSADTDIPQGWFVLGLSYSYCTQSHTTNSTQV